MFDEMVSLLKQGEMVQLDLLRKRFDGALVKKLGVIKTPYSFWSSDKKINPAAKELLWATILLEDRDNFMLVEGIIVTELDEKLRAKGLQNSTDHTHKVEQTMQDFIAEFLGLAPSAAFKKILQQKLSEVVNLYSRG
ncbi:MAG: hypothetical protein IME97_04520 [Proteobacteria bacterium]|nr:hypothetical protein [Pseudomonadota bacterium]